LENLTLGNNNHPVHSGHCDSTELVNVSIRGFPIVGRDVSWQEACGPSYCSSPPNGSSTLFSSDLVSPTWSVVDSPGRENCIEDESSKILVKATYKGEKGQPMKIVKEVHEQETMISENIVKDHHVVMMIGMIKSIMGDVELINL